MSNNPIVAQIGDVKIRPVNCYRVSLTADELTKLAEIRLLTGLSISKIIAVQGRSCMQCGCDNATITVPKNILSAKKQTSGGHKKTNTLTDGQ
jgi:hypothetical protein